MNAWIGWGLAAVAAVMAGLRYGAPGVAVAVSVTVFWLLLQYSRALRVLRRAGQRPVGAVDSALMLHARLRPGLRLAQVLALTHSLGVRVPGGASEGSERWRWVDAGGVAVVLVFRGGRLAGWTLERPDQASGQAAATGAAAAEASADRSR